jgi:TolA-binding protein
MVSMTAAGPAFAKKAEKKIPLEDLKMVEGDERGNEVKSLKVELLVAASEELALKQAQKLIKKYRGTPMEPELHFRLAELYMRKSKTDQFFEVHRESETVVKLAPRVVKNASSRKSVQQAADTYALIIRKFADFEQMDLVVFNYAFAKQILGLENQAETLYQNLISKFPESPLVPDAHLAIGEIAFGQAKFNLALEHFNAIQKYPKSRVYPYGLYKAAWTYYNMRDAKSALLKLEEVVTFGKYVAENGIEARLDLRKEALSDMVLFYEDVMPSSSAYAYFVKQAGEAEAGPILLKMGELYDRHSRFNDERIVLDEFVQKLPKSPLMPTVHTNLVLAYDQLRQKDQAVNRLESFSKICDVRSSWIRASGPTDMDRSKTSAECVQLLNETSLKLAKKWLKGWKKLPADTSFAEASEKAFEVFLRTPGNGPEYAESRYAYAELLFARKKYRKASEEYAAVSHAGGSAQILHDSSYGALIALEKAVGEKWSNEDEKQFHQLAEFYLTKNPKGQYRLDINYKMALLAYEKERYDEAAPIFIKIGKEFGNTEKGQKSQDLYLDILNIKKDFHAIRNYANELAKTANNPARVLKMRKLHEQAHFLEAQSFEDKGQLREALVEYQSFSKQNPTSDLSEKAYWNTMQLHFKMGDAWNGSHAAEDFAAKFPKSPQTVNALLRAAQTFEQMAQLGEAARVLERLADLDEKSAVRWKELAADFYALSENVPSARKLFKDLRSRTQDSKKKLELLNKMAALEETFGNEASKAEMQKQLIDHDVQPYANDAKVKRVEAILAKGNMTEAFNQSRHLLGSSAMTANDKARLRMVQAKVLDQEFRSQSVKSKVERVATVLALKTEKLQKVQEALQSAIKFGDPGVSLEGFEMLYGCYSHYVKALKEMPVPAGVNEQDAKAFRAEIDQLVIPLEEKSVDTLAQAVEFAHKQVFLDGRGARLEAMLAKINQQNAVDLSPTLEKPHPVIPLLAGGRL